MTAKFIPIVQNPSAHSEAANGFVFDKNFIYQPGRISDQLKRPLKDLRISVTDRCNFRCTYCMPKEIFDSNYKYLPHADLLSFEEITRIAKSFIALGVEKIRITGGEPLLRKNIERLIEQLSALKTLEGKEIDLTLTTNGSLLARKAQSLKDAGLKRVTVSLDALSDQIFKTMNDVDFPVSCILEGIESAVSVGLAPLKVNMVVKKGVNEEQILPMTEYFLRAGITLRFIEFMDVGATNGWRMDDVVPSAQVLHGLQNHFSISPLDSDLTSLSETAKRYLIKDSKGHTSEIGFISSVTQAFCADCSRARLSTEGQLYLCLFASKGYDFKTLVRSGSSEAELQSRIAQIWHHRDDQYSQLRSLQKEQPSAMQKRVEMSYIGG
jgi:GTP 3',8-cyclase